MIRWLIDLFRKPGLPAPHPACVVGHKKYYRIMPWRMAK